MTAHDNDPIPSAPRWLGTAGLLPFVVCAGGLWSAPEAYGPTLTFWLTAYGAVILTFVGAVHWGVALIHPRMREADRAVFLAWSVVPALVAWLALVVAARTGLLLLAAGFIVQYAADGTLTQRFTLPPWYLRLRRSLTTVVVLSLLVSLARLAHGLPA